MVVEDFKKDDSITFDAVYEYDYKKDRYGEYQQQQSEGLVHQKSRDQEDAHNQKRCDHGKKDKDFYAEDPEEMLKSSPTAVRKASGKIVFFPLDPMDERSLGPGVKEK